MGVTVIVDAGICTGTPGCKVKYVAESGAGGAGVGVGGSCISDVACEVRWTYRGDPDDCATVTYEVTDPEGAVIETAAAASRPRGRRLDGGCRLDGSRRRDGRVGHNDGTTAS